MANLYPPGQCTWWCADQAPWVQRYGNLGNAKDWAATWKAHGGVVASTPTDGDVVCFQPGADGADAGFGHVAVVVGSGVSDFLVSEMNGPAGPGHTDDRLCQLVPGCSFLVQSTSVGDDDLTPEEHQWLSDIHQALFAATAPEGSAPWNNNEIIRRELVQLGADYNLHPGPIPAPKAGTP